MKKGRNLLFLTILLLGIGFATVSTTLYINGDVNISANSEDFDVRFTKAVIDSEDKTGTVISEDGKVITYTTKELQALNDKSILDFEVTNNSSLYDAEVSIECTTGEASEYYQITKNVASTISSKTTETGSVEVQKIKATTEDIEEVFTCTLTAVAKERTIKGEEPIKVNKNILNKDLECLKNKEVGSCEAGTEIRYMVNDSDEKTFHVLHDDGDIMTLQQNEDTITSIAWYADAQDNTKGPLTALTALENAVSGWTNVDTINYTMGLTNFNNTNAFTGCGDEVCTVNAYTLENRSSKARMITVQELRELGCTLTEKSCQDFLTQSSNYWTMNSNSDATSNAWFVLNSGRIAGNITSNSLGARAVIVISK